MRLNIRQTVTFLDALIVKLRPELFHKACMERTSKIRLNFTANSFGFGHINRDNAPKNFFYKSRKVKTSKMRLNFAGNGFIFGKQIVKLRPELSS